MFGCWSDKGHMWVDLSLGLYGSLTNGSALVAPTVSQGTKTSVPEIQGAGSGLWFLRP